MEKVETCKADRMHRFHLNLGVPFLLATVTLDCMTLVHDAWGHSRLETKSTSTGHVATKTLHRIRNTAFSTTCTVLEFVFLRSASGRVSSYQRAIARILGCRM